MNDMRTYLTHLRSEWHRDDVPRQAAAIAYYSIFTLPAFAIVIITIAGRIMSERTITQELMNQIIFFAGQDIAEMLLIALYNLQMHSTNPLLTVFSALFLLFSSLNVIRQLRVSLNRILRGTPITWKWQHVLTGYAVSVVLLLCIVALLISSIVLSATLSYLETHFISLIDLPWTIIDLSNTGITFFALTVLLTLLYRLLPNMRFPFSSIVRSSLLTTGLMMVSARLFTSIISNFSIGKAYGVAASLLVFLLWIDVMAMIFLFGAELLDCERMLKQNQSQYIVK